MPISPYVAQCGEYPFRLLHVEAGGPQPGDDWIRRFAPIPPRVEVGQQSGGLFYATPHGAILVQPCAGCAEHIVRRDFHAQAGGLDKTVRGDVEPYGPTTPLAQALRLETLQQVGVTVPPLTDVRVRRP